jgi:GNAT superfamily N-acetyltransferase
MNASYGLRFFEPADRGALEDFYRAVYGETWPQNTRLGWYADQPLADAGASLAVTGKTIAAAQPYFDLPLQTPWGSARSTLLLDVATHPQHRRQGLFRRVVAAARAAAFERGASLVMSTPNETAFRGFQTMPEWQELCSLDCLFMPMGAGKKANGAGALSLGARAVFAGASMFWEKARTKHTRPDLPQYVIDAPWTPGPDADSLWKEASDNHDIVIPRDLAFLRWRFDGDYRLFLARAPQGPVGYAAARVVSRSGLRLGILLDCILAHNTLSALPLLAAVVAWLREQGVSASIAYFVRHSAAWQIMRNAGFFRLAKPIIPRKYPVCVSVHSEHPHGAELLNASRWHMSLADSDLA